MCLVREQCAGEETAEENVYVIDVWRPVVVQQQKISGKLDPYNANETEPVNGTGEKENSESKSLDAIALSHGISAVLFP